MSEVGNSASEASTNSAAAASTGTEEVARSIKCTDCNKVFNNETEASAHASRTNHQNFAESTEEKMPLTEEEKKAQLEKVKQLLAEKKAAREEKERKETIEQEKLRRKQGQEISTSKEYYQNMQAKLNAEEIRNNKIADAKARQKIKDQIAKDKADRAARAAQQKAEREGIPLSTTTTAATTKSNTTISKKEMTHNSARIQIRLSDGRNITQTFNAQDSCSQLFEFVLQSTGSTDVNRFSLMSPVPPRPTYMHADYANKTFRDAKLCPSAMLIYKAL